MRAIGFNRDNNHPSYNGVYSINRDLQEVVGPNDTADALTAAVVKVLATASKKSTLNH